MIQQEYIEQLADKEHASWARWMQYLFSKCRIVKPDVEVPSDVIIPASLVVHWQEQMDTPYEQLGERDKQSYRDEVAHILPIIEKIFSEKKGIIDVFR